MSETPLYKCGHPRTEDNAIGRHNRCRTCYFAKRVRERENRKRAANGLPPIMPPRRGRLIQSKLIAAPPVEALAIDPAPAFERGSQNLLKALFVSHPYVFEAAERAGRQVVRP